MALQLKPDQIDVVALAPEIESELGAHAQLFYVDFEGVGGSMSDNMLPPGWFTIWNGPGDYSLVHGLGGPVAYALLASDSVGPPTPITMNRLILGSPPDFSVLHLLLTDPAGAPIEGRVTGAVMVG